jgi:hypothetical protein
MEIGATWAIFSDRYGVWFPDVRHQWYEKDPNTVTTREFSLLLQDFEEKLRKFSEIYFYYNPGRFHRLYERILKETALAARVIRITHLLQIK